MAKCILGDQLGALSGKNPEMLKIKINYACMLCQVQYFFCVEELMAAVKKKLNSKVVKNKALNTFQKH